MFQPPIFIDEANGDFHLKVSSPCIDAGTATDAPSTDYEGDSRPMGGGIDMGIDETPYNQSDCFFVTTSGDNANDGLTEATAWRTITYAVTQVAAGDKINVKAGDYGDEKIDLDRSGLSGQTIKIWGYKTTPGDHPLSTYQPGDALDPAVMPLLKGTDNLGDAFTLTNEDYWDIRNFQISVYQAAINSTTGSDNNYFSNIIGVEFGVPSDLTYAYGFYITGQNNTIDNCIITDAGNYCFFLAEDNNTISNSYAYGHTDHGSGPVGYYFHILGNYNTVENCIAKELYSLGYDSGHGIGARDGANNNFINCEAYNTNNNFYARWAGAHDNTFTNCRAYNGNNGITVRDGVYNNTFDKCRVIGSSAGVGFYDSTENGQNDPCAYDNTFTNCLFEDVGNMFNLSVPAAGSYASNVNNNKFINCTIVNPENLFKDRMPNSNNEIVNCIITDVNQFIQLGNTGTAYPINFSLDYCDYYNSDAIPGNISLSNMIYTDPLFEDPANDDYHIKDTSPCSNAGTSTNAPTTDFEGNPRPFGGGYDIGYDENTAVLFIELAEFYAIPKEEEVLLKWATQTENNNDYFVIQKSKNAIDWEDLEKIVGAGNSYEKINYSYPDRNPYSGTSYYRLKYFDYDGEFEYSRIAPVKFGADNTIVFYPNPVKDRLIIEKEEDTSIEIFNLIGVKMLETTSSVINVSKFESGTYLLILKDEFGNSIGFERFLKS